jgi:hypothetical protein
MAPLIFLLVSLALLIGFLSLTNWESKRGLRFFATLRTELDRRVEEALFIFNHVDFNSYLRDEARALAIHFGHYVAHLTLQGVRFIERLLTQTVRQLRAKVASETVAPKETTRPFVQALSGFKEELKATRPPIPEL